MKNFFLGLVLCCACILVCTPASAVEKSHVGAPSNPVDQFTGVLWQHSTEAEKLAFLFGVESAITIEHFVNAEITQQAVKEGKKPVYTLSPFEKGWMQAFKDVHRKELARQVDAWYAAHPDQLKRPVMAVIWYEVIVPCHHVKK